MNKRGLSAASVVSLAGLACACACASRTSPALLQSTAAASAPSAAPPPSSAIPVAAPDVHAEPAPADIFVPAPAQLDGALPSPGIANLRGVGAREAWVSFWIPEGVPSYDAVVDLDTGCVTETLPTREAGFPAVAPSLGGGGAGGEVSASLEKRLGSYLAFLARFDHLVVGARTRALHSDGVVAFTRDHTKVAIVVNGGVLVSRDGGRGWTRIQGLAAGSVSTIHFSPNGHHLVFEGSETTPKGSVSMLGFLDMTADIPPMMVALPDRTIAVGTTDDGRELYSKDDRCLYAVTPDALALRKVACIAGPRIDKNHFFATELSPDGRVGLVLDDDFQATRGNVYAVDDGHTLRVLPGALDLHNGPAGPGLEGRYAWGRPHGGMRVSTPDGAFDLATDDAALGFDLTGRLVTFQRPALVRPHKPGQMMPRPVGTLADVKCALVRAVDPKTGTKVR